MSLVAALVAGGAVGATHALESDHVAAVAGLLDGERSGLAAGTVGASWGVGHTLPIAALGLAMVAAGVRLPPAVTAFFEAVVGLLLVAIGGRLLLSVRRDRERAAQSSSHDSPAAHGHGGRLHRHLGLGDLDLGVAHSHLHGEAFAVGAVHGVAGSGALVVALVAEAPTAGAATAFLAAFGVCSVCTMAGVSLCWGRALDAGRRRALSAVAGAVGVAVGLRLLWATVGV
ncbi:MAG: high-affinity nickel-transporter protein [Halobacteriaceae archaeon]